MTGGAKEQVGRLLTLVPYIQTQGEVHIDRAAADLGLTPKQLVSDLKVLWMCGLPGLLPGDLIDVDIDALEEDGDGVIRVSNADYLTRPLRLTASEASALIVALRTLRESADEAVIEVVDRTLKKLSAAAEDGAALAGHVDVRIGERERETGRLRATLADAIDRGRQVRLAYYVPARDEETERIVDPLALGTTQGSTYLDAWCHTAEDNRLFRLDRINHAEVLDEPVGDHSEIGPRDLSEGLFQPSRASHRVTLRLAPSARWVAEYYPVETTREAGDGRLEIEMLVGDPQWLQRLLLRLAPHAEVLEPQEFTEEFRANAQAALRLYT